MTYKTILLHLDPGDACKKRTAVAIEMARAFDAHLIGLYYVHPFPVPGYTPARPGQQLCDRLEEVVGDEP